jgi:hypothetical protein
MAELVLRAASVDDVEAVCALMRRTFPDNAKADERILRWQYWENPFGPAVAWVWADGPRIVGHFGCIRYGALVGGVAATIGVAIDAAIDPDYQGRRLFGPLTTALFDDMARSGLPVTVSYPNDKSVGGLVRGGWQEIGLLRTHLLMLDAGWYAKRVRVPRFVMSAVRRVLFRPPRAGSDVVVEEAAPPADLDGLWASLAPGVMNGVVRDSTWFTWRYVSRPLTPYRFFSVRRGGRLVGVAVTTEREQHGGAFAYLLEFLAVDAEAARALVQVVSASYGGAVGVVLATLPGTSASRLALGAGLRLVPSRFEEKALHMGVIDNDASRGAGIRSDWTLGWGDLDHL